MNATRMHRRDWILVGILGAGNLLVWGERLVTAVAPTGFDFETFERDARAAWNQSKLVERPFTPDSVIPESHLHLRAEDPKDPLYSVYLGQYSRMGILEAEPHDPKLCYHVAGYQLLRGPEDVILEADGHRYAVNRIEVSRSTHDDNRLELTTYYWHQLAGRMPAAETGMPGPWTQVRARYLEGRSDLVWVRVELRGRDRLLDAALRDRLLALMRSASRAMRR